MQTGEERRRQMMEAGWVGGKEKNKKKRMRQEEEDSTPQTFSDPKTYQPHIRAKATKQTFLPPVLTRDRVVCHYRN